MRRRFGGATWWKFSWRRRGGLSECLSLRRGGDVSSAPAGALLVSQGAGTCNTPAHSHVHVHKTPRRVLTYSAPVLHKPSGLALRS